MKQMELSLGSGTFSVLEEQFNAVLNKTLGNMEMKGASAATITLKLDIELDKDSRDFGNGYQDFTLPKFKHTINSVMQVKDKATGELTGDYAMIFDAESGQYVLQKIDDGQMDILNDDDADYPDVEYKELPEASRGLPEPATEDDNDEDSSYTTEDDSGDTDASPDFTEGSEPESFRLFAWLQQFTGDTMSVTEGGGSYTVRSSKNKIILSSATDPSSPLYVDSDKLAEHVGHPLSCVACYEDGGEESLERIEIRCPECDEVIFELKAPWIGDEDEDYKYEQPEE